MFHSLIQILNTIQHMFIELSKYFNKYKTLLGLIHFLPSFISQLIPSWGKKPNQNSNTSLNLQVVFFTLYNHNLQTPHNLQNWVSFVTSWFSLAILKAYRALKLHCNGNTRACTCTSFVVKKQVFKKMSCYVKWMHFHFGLMPKSS